MAGDGNAANNAMAPVSLTVDPTITGFPYFQDFEASTGGWRSVSLGGVDDWEYGVPNYSGTYSINTANSGTKVWATRLTTTYSNGSHCALLSPCLNFSTLTAPVLQFYANYASESGYDGWVVEASSNGGQTWNSLTPLYPAYNYTYTYGPQPAPQYSSTTLHGWRKYVFPLTAYALQASVKVRFRFGSDGSVNSYPGLALDDVAIGDFLQKDVQVTDIVYDNATNYWARRQGASHKVHARIVNLGYEANPTSIPLTYKDGSAPAFQGDGTAQTFTPAWSGSSAWVSFTTEHTPGAAGPMNFYVGAFYSGDQKASNDFTMTVPNIQPLSVYGFEDFNMLTPPNWEKLWSVKNQNADATWLTTAGNGIGGSVTATYPGDVNAADDWLFTPGAWLLAGSSYSLDFQYRSRTGAPQILEVAFGPSPNPASMTVFATYNNFTNTSFTPGLNSYGVAPFFATPNVAQLYYIGFRVKSAAGAGELDLDGIRLYDNPFPPPKIAYGIDPIYIDDPLIPIQFTGVYKKTGVLSRTYEVVNSTGWYGNPEGDMLWDVNCTASWIKLTKSTPDPLTYLTVNPFNPPWARQRQTFTMDVNASILPVGTYQTTLDFDAYLYNTVYTRGIRASNAIFRIPVEIKLSSAGGVGTSTGPASMSFTGLFPGGGPYEFKDNQGVVFATVNVVSGVIPSMTIYSYPGQLPRHISRYRYVDHYWTIDAPGTGWVANVQFHYFDSEVLSGGVFDENWLRGMRIAPGTSWWEDPIAGTTSTPNDFYNYVHVSNINPSNVGGEFAVAHDWSIPIEGKQGVEVPSSYSLGQNFPNPFNPSTEIKFALPEQQYVSIVVMNSLGEEVATLVNKTLPAGYHSVRFDASKLQSGMYLYTLKAGEFVQTRSMILAK